MAKILLTFYVDGKLVERLVDVEVPRKKLRINPMVLLDIKTSSFYGTPAEWCEL